MDTPKVYLSGNFLIHSDHGAMDLRAVRNLSLFSPSKDADLSEGVAFDFNSDDPSVFWHVADASERQSLLSLFSEWAKMQVPFPGVIAYEIEANLGSLSKMDAEIIAGYHKTPVRKDGEPIPINDLLQGFIDSKMKQIAAKSGIPQPGDPYPDFKAAAVPKELIEPPSGTPRRKGREFL